MRRAIPQNYAVLLQNLPNDIDSVEKLQRLIRQTEFGIAKIVPLPREMRELNKLYKELRSAIG